MARPKEMSKFRVEKAVKSLVANSALGNTLFPATVRAAYTGVPGEFDVEVRARKGGLRKQTPRSLRRLVAVGIGQHVSEPEVLKGQHETSGQNLEGVRLRVNVGARKLAAYEATVQ